MEKIQSGRQQVIEIFVQVIVTMESCQSSVVFIQMKADIKPADPKLHLIGNVIILADHVPDRRTYSDVCWSAEQSCVPGIEN